MSSAGRAFCVAVLAAATAACAGRAPSMDIPAGPAPQAQGSAEGTGRADPEVADGRRTVLDALEETLRAQAPASDSAAAATLERLAQARTSLVAAASAADFYSAVNDVLDGAGTPHLHLYRPGRDLFGRDAAENVMVGATLRNVDGYYFVDDVWEGGPADQAGLRYGDELIPVSGTAPVLDPLPPGQRSVRLWVRRDRDTAPFFVDVEAAAGPFVWYLAESTRASLRVESRAGCRVGVIHLRTFADEDLIQELITGAHFDNTDGLVIDLRNNRGGEVRLAGEVFDLLSRRPSLWIHYHDRIYSFPPTSWNRPLAVIVDSTTHSAAELFAASVQVLQLGTVVGMPTAGRVQASRLFDLPDGSRLLVPVSRVTLLDGTELESRGVIPDLPVERSLLYAAGVDPPMGRALDVLAQQMVCSEELPGETFPQESVGAVDVP